MPHRHSESGVYYGTPAALACIEAIAREVPGAVLRPIELMVSQADRMAKIVRNLLLFARQRPDKNDDSDRLDWVLQGGTCRMRPEKRRQRACASDHQNARRHQARQSMGERLDPACNGRRAMGN